MKEKVQVAVLSLIITAGIILGVFIAIPVQEHNTITYVSWTWSIPVYTYTKHEEKSWSTPPEGAYNIRKKQEYRKTVTKTDSTGKKYKEKVYDTRYYYYINKWDYSYDINSTGIDKQPYESSAGDLPSSIKDPQLGDVKRGEHTEKYECNINGNVFEISKEDWNRVEKGCTITYKRHHFSKKLYDIQFG